MTRKLLGTLIGAGFLLVIIGSSLGVVLYKSFFETPTYYYIPQETLPTTFSKYTEPTPSTASVQKESQVSAIPDFIQASDQARPAVVHIKSRFEARRSNRNSEFFSNPFRDFFDEDMEIPHEMASGSGVLISPDGYIATNNHVIEEADEVSVILFDNRTFTAKVIGTDVSTDLALLKIDGKDLPHLPFGDSDEVQVGQWVLAVGNPMDLKSTVTAGIVSAKGRNINLLRADSEYAIESFIQTDAAVNKGNSGGALVDLTGRLIGINTAIASRTGYYAGYSFAIPSTIARKVMEDLLSFGEVRRGFLGVSIQAVNAELASARGLHTLKGAYVSMVNPTLGAAEAGIQEGDVIISVNDQEVNSSSELQEQVSRYRPGDQIRIRVFRGKAEKNFNVRLKPITGAIRQTTQANPEIDDREEYEFKGSQFRLLTGDELEKFEVESGVFVKQAGDKMSRGGIQEGFVITEVDGRKIRSIADLERSLQNSGDFVTIKGLYNKGMIASYSFSW
ncbi:MAG: Do family serine endopeptidase [Bacteroidota bacterium]